jgi:parvulin-like peptidyl-prolyl isomerase
MTDGPAEPTPTSIPRKKPATRSVAPKATGLSVPSPSPRRSAPPGPSKGFGARILNWFSPQDLERAPAAVREQVQSRIAAVVLGGIAVVSVATVGGAVLWDQVLYGQQASLKVDGKTITLDEYRAWFSYRQNILLANLQQAEANGGSSTMPTPVPGDSAASQAYSMQEMWRQRASQLQGELNSLSTSLTDEFIDRPILRAEASRRNITITSEDVDKELKTITGFEDPAGTPTPTTSETPTVSAGNPSPTAPASTPTVIRTPRPTPTVRTRKPNTLEQAIRDYAKFAGSTYEMVREDAELTILKRKLSEAFGEEAPKTGEQVKARHILVGDEDAARKVLDRLKSGEEFDALAAELSTDGSNKDKGGDLGWFGRGTMVTPFEDAAFALPVGQISEPVKTQFGVHVIRVDEKDSTKPLEESQYQRVKEEAFTKWIATERDTKKPERLMTETMRNWVVKHATPLNPTALKS